MRHLNPEILARIAEGPASEAERAHLDACAECRAEVDALRRQTRTLGALDPPPVPAAVWRGVEARLAAERLAGGAVVSRRPSWARRWLPRAAAALALFAGGLATGMAMVGGPVPDPRPAERAERMPAPDPWPAADPETGSAAPIVATPAPVESSPRVATAGRLAATPRPATAAEAARIAALSRLARLETAADVDAARRLAALESILATTRAARDVAPDDPLIDGYHRAALAQRQALVREVGLVDGDAWY